MPSRASKITRDGRKNELDTQLVLLLNPHYRKIAQVLAVLAVLSCCTVDIANYSLFPESMHDAGRCRTGMLDSSD